MKYSFIYKLSMTILIPILMILFFYFTAIHKYEHKAVLGMKIYEEPQLMLNRYKQSDIVLSPEEFSLLSTSNPELTYISEPEYIFMINGKKIYVTQQQYNSYQEGDTIIYYNECFFDFPSLNK